MPVQRALTLERLEADAAGVGPVVGVRLHVHVQVGSVEERLGALRAFERALFGVRPLVVH